MAHASTSRPPTAAERRTARLAELVSGLTGCETGGALHAVREQDGEDALEIVARAMVEVDGPPPEGFRVAGFLRDDTPATHGSPRRWEARHPEPDRVEDAIPDTRFDA